MDDLRDLCAIHAKSSSDESSSDESMPSSPAAPAIVRARSMVVQPGDDDGSESEVEGSESEVDGADPYVYIDDSPEETIEPGELPAMDLSVIYGFESDSSGDSSGEDDFTPGPRRAKKPALGPRQRRRIQVPAPVKDEINIKVQPLEINVPFDFTLEAIATYRAVFGSCNVPASYIVPSTELWPEHLHGLRLGAVIAQVRASPAMLQQRQLLDAIGFAWTSKRGHIRCIVVPPLTSGRREAAVARPAVVVLGALRLYRDLYGSLEIPTDFVVPPFSRPWIRAHEGLMLAHTLPSFAVHAYELLDDDATDARALGLLHGVPPWASLLALLRDYLERFDASAVPVHFVIPSDDMTWPVESHGVKLGDIAWTLGVREPLLPRSCKRQLAELDMELCSDASWAAIVSALEAFADAAGHVHVPPDYICGDIHLGYWAERLVEADRLQLLPRATAQTLKWLRSRATSVVCDDDDDAPADAAPTPRDDVWTATIERFDEACEWKARLAALRQYHNRFGHLLVPEDYVLESTEPSLALYPLGDQVLSLRRRRRDVDAVRTDALDALGFVWDLWAHELWPTLEDAVVATPSPLPETAALSSLNDSPCGYYWTLLEIHDGFATRWYQDRLKKLGFDATTRWAAKLDALSMFDAVFQHLHVPPSFVVPDAPPWPPQTHHLPLGLMVQWIRQCQAHIHAARKAELDGRHFEWIAIDFGDVDAGLAQYKLLVDADADVPPTFVIPSHAPWPEGLWQLALGALLAKQRVYLRRMTAVHADLLAALGVPGVPPPSLQHVRYNWFVVVSALDEFRGRFGHSEVPLLYTIPTVGGKWVRSLLGMPLGFFARVCRDHLARLVPHVQQSLLSLGFASANPRRYEDGEILPSPLSPPRPSATPMAPLKPLAATARKTPRAHHRMSSSGSSADTPLVVSRKRTASSVPLMEPPARPLPRDVTPDDNESPSPVVPSPLRRNMLATASLAEPESASSMSDEPVPSPTPSENDDAGIDVDDTSDFDAAKANATSLDGQELFEPDDTASLPPSIPLLRACHVFYKNFGHMNIPRSFVVPSNDAQWPPDAWDVPLGAHWHASATTRRCSIHRPPAELVEEGLAAYMRRTGHEHVSPTFVIPDDDTWPADVRRLRLGAALQRSRAPPPDIVVNWSLCLLALSTYRATFYHVNVPAAFVVPTQAWEWPEELGDYPLGDVLCHIRAGRVPLRRSDATRLERLGFAFVLG
ncbi:hypothetical protein SPRG_08950 [Saprolegnia parasitica CBS 223.65]|uniref:Helicase-associated domain-containing protein n=1 Tax=Saprolegnia parasitica (strain CBS 223.65) TaxID=695850 RepID=A0A067CGI8_SAPPC|nr:hypothetical protein SPRG_08950 [Saprolegnia parasitica CBS 223.65]KDO25651.1 hypothetical protein SPRG_08950 [Saprolegnia parasitica CBS 223.65]|eukprot:XP_012203682.1 hypothetical protein SPRG_08950 [Saprolegnia parasitica CBS 223.65]